jgi:hypothetical protein
MKVKDGTRIGIMGVIDRDISSPTAIALISTTFTI